MVRWWRWGGWIVSTRANNGPLSVSPSPFYLGSLYNRWKGLYDYTTTAVQHHNSRAAEEQENKSRHSWWNPWICGYFDDDLTSSSISRVGKRKSEKLKDILEIWQSLCAIESAHFGGRRSTERQRVTGPLSLISDHSSPVRVQHHPP